MFTNLFGGAPHARVFDFLADGHTRDHTIMEISQGSEVSRPTVYKVLDDFIQKDVVVETRTLGNSRFFQLDKSNQTVVSLLEVAKPTEFADFEIPAAEEPSRRMGPRRTRSQR